ncbi:MAG: radical SAM family heme chaperone HemW [Desulfobacterales bacterium]|nr:radical SAM family heme chaperone HemW [Desulfobacterales bacterium]
MNHHQPAGIYIHIPFCLRKCLYCDFYSVTDLSLQQVFARALASEIKMASDVQIRSDTLYIGGGTPSVFDAENISRIIESACHSFTIIPGTEITIETNPGTVTLGQLRDYYRAGVNRINIGVQSLTDANLKFLGRIHSARDGYLAIEWARKAGFDNLGIDLICGIPGQTKKTWLSDLNKAVEFEPEHLSCYVLTYEPGTPLHNDLQRRLFCPMDEKPEADLFETTIEFLSDNGYMQYEISNFARSVSKRSRHNQKYWSGVPYRGFGPSAHSFTGTERFWNYCSVEKYIDEIDAGRLPTEGKETLTREQQIIEAVYVGLRKTHGIDIRRFDEKFGISFNRTFREAICCFEENGLIKTDSEYCVLSRKGMLFHNSIVSFIISHSSF